MTNELRTNEPPAALLPVRWYVVANYGAATLCLDEADARKVAHECDLAWPANAPHVAVQLAPVALAAAPTPAALRDRLLVALERAASAETKLAALQIEYDKLTSTAPGANESRGSVPDGWRKHELLDIARFLCRPYSLGSTRTAICEVVKGFGEEIRRIAKGMSSAPTPPAVASGEPAAEQWRKLVDELATDLENEIENRRTGELPRRIERDLEIVREARRMLARSAAAKGEG